MKELTRSEVHELLTAWKGSTCVVKFNPQTGAVMPWELHGVGTDGVLYRKITSYKSEKSAIKALKKEEVWVQRCIADFQERLNAFNQ